MPVRQQTVKVGPLGTGNTTGNAKFTRPVSGEIRTIVYHETNAPAGLDVFVEALIDGHWIEINTETDLNGTEANFLTRVVDGDVRARVASGDGDTEVDFTVIYQTFTD